MTKNQPKRNYTGTSRGTTAIVVLLALMVIFYAAFQMFGNRSDTYRYATVYSFSTNDETTFSGYVVREEAVLPNQTDGLLSITREEGERVGAGQSIATLYSSADSVEADSRLEALYARLEYLNYALDETTSATMGAKLDTGIQADLIALQKNRHSGQYAAMEKNISELKALIIKRDYSSSGATAEELTDAITAVRGEIRSLESQQAKGAKKITVSKAGLFSAAVDGYESVLTPEALETMTPSQLAGAKADSSVSSNVGKMVYGDTWYYVMNMDESTAASYKVGNSVTLRFVKALDRDLTMTVSRVSDSEHGQKLVVLRCNAYLPEVTLLRYQSATVVHESFTGLRVPTEALRVNEGVTGVYCLVGMQAVFKPAEIVYQGSGYYLVSPAKKADDTENTGSSRLREGDQVIITAEDLYNKKVVD